MNAFLEWCGQAGEWLFIGFGLTALIDSVLFLIRLYF